MYELSLDNMSGYTNCLGTICQGVRVVFRPNVQVDQMSGCTKCPVTQRKASRRANQRIFNSILHHLDIFTRFCSRLYNNYYSCHHRLMFEIQAWYWSIGSSKVKPLLCSTQVRQSLLPFYELWKINLPTSDVWASTKVHLTNNYQGNNYSDHLNESKLSI